MSEELVPTTDTAAVAEQQSAEPQSVSTILQQQAWGDIPPVQPQVEEKKDIPDTPAIPTATGSDDEETFDENIYLKNKFGWDNSETALNEIKSLREKAEKTGNFEFKNDDSKKIAEYINEGKIDDLYSFLDMQKRVDKLMKADLSDKNIAAELVRFGIQRDNPNLSSEDVDFLFNEQYSIAKEPKQRDDELDDDFAERHSAWNEQRERVERKMMIEAKMAQPKLAQLKSELVLPEIKKEVAPQQNEPTAEQLAEFEKYKSDYLQSVEQSVTNLNHVSLTVKDKDVELPLKYDFTQQEKDAVSQRMKDFAANGYNATAILADLWVTPQGNVNTNRMSEDLAFLLFRNNITQKFADDAANKRLEAYFKEKKQIDVTGNNERGTFNPENKTAHEKMQEHFWGN